jgi:hypothetical protein
MLQPVAAPAFAASHHRVGELRLNQIYLVNNSPRHVRNGKTNLKFRSFHYFTAQENVCFSFVCLLGAYQRPKKKIKMN